MATVTPINVQDAAAVRALLGKRRSRGIYSSYLVDFEASGELARQVDFENGPLTGKNPTSAKQSLMNALASTKNPVPNAENISVVLDTDQDPPLLYVVNEAVLNGGAEATDEDE